MEYLKTFCLVSDLKNQTNCRQQQLLGKAWKKMTEELFVVLFIRSKITVEHNAFLFQKSHNTDFTKHLSLLSYQDSQLLALLQEVAFKDQVNKCHLRGGKIL